MHKARLENLLKIIKSYKNLKSFCLNHDLSYSYINQIINGSRDIGEKAARNLEKKIGLPEMTLEDSTDKIEMSVNEELTVLYAKAPEDVKYAVSFLLSPPGNARQFAENITGAVNEYPNDDLFEDFDSQS